MDRDIKEQLDRIEHKLDRLFLQGVFTMADLSALTAAVTNETNVVASAITLIQGLASQIAANATDPVAISALASQLTSSASALATAIAANTPAAPAAPPVTPPTP